MNVSRQHRGTALLITLGAMVVGVTAASISAHALVARSMNARSQLRTDRVADLLHAAEPAISSWLVDESNGITLPPEVAEPQVSVLADRWLEGDDVIELRITAWDQDGMLPLRTTLERRELMRLCPDSISDALSGLETQPRSILGLDVFTGPVHAIPLPKTPEWTAFGDQREPGEPERSDSSSTESHAEAIGAWIATHPSRPGTVSMNINTTPIPLLQDVMRLAGRGGIEQIIQARATGRLAIAERSGRTAREPETTRYEFRASSGSWAFRIDARIGPVRRTWWEVWTRSGQGWERRQRLVF